MKFLTTPGTRTDLTPEEWVGFHFPFGDERNPRFERELQESVKVDPERLLKAKNAIKTWCRKEDQDFCALCLIVVAGPKESRSRQLAHWVDYTKSDLNHLRQIEQKHLERIPRMMVAAQMFILPKPTLGTSDSHLSQYIRELAVLIEVLKRDGGQRDMRDDALFLLVSRLRKNKRLPKLMWNKIALAVDKLGEFKREPVSGEQLRLRYERKLDRDYPPTWKLVCRLQGRKKDDSRIKQLREELKALKMR